MLTQKFIPYEPPVEIKSNLNTLRRYPRFGINSTSRRIDTRPEKHRSARPTVTVPENGKLASFYNSLNKSLHSWRSSSGHEHPKRADARRPPLTALASRRRLFRFQRAHQNAKEKEKNRRFWGPIKPSLRYRCDRAITRGK